MKQILTKAAHTAWRLLPREFRRNAMTGIAARLARRPDWPGPTCSDGIAVAGDISGSNGLAETARLMHAVFEQAGLARGLLPLGLPSVVEPSDAAIPPGAALLTVVNAPILPVGLLRLRRDLIAGRRVIGMWAWELPVVPKQWRYAADFVHEVWAPSQFTADAIETMAPGRVRVVPYPLAAFGLPVTGTRDTFGLPHDRVIVLTAFNLASSPTRKNPLGAIAAFKRAFGRNQDFLLVIKISGETPFAVDLAAIKLAAADWPNIKLIVGTLEEAQLRGLIRASDIVMSLHRSEGFGLIPAAAMLLGKPVVATGWSGNLTFMSKDTSALVSYRMIKPEDARGVYEIAGASWADPDIEDAAHQLKRLGEDQALRHSIGEAGRHHAREMLGTAPVLAALAANGIA
jgi:glycosyltransferase involved in cell wall biosynthesis